MSCQCEDERCDDYYLYIRQTLIMPCRTAFLMQMKEEEILINLLIYSTVHKREEQRGKNLEPTVGPKSKDKLRDAIPIKHSLSFHISHFTFFFNSLFFFGGFSLSLSPPLIKVNRKNPSWFWGDHRYLLNFSCVIHLIISFSIQ